MRMRRVDLDSRITATQRVTTRSRKPRPLTLALLGGGKMGCDVAACFAAGGWEVHVYEPMAAARDTFARRLAAALKPMRAPRNTRQCVTLHDDLPALPWQHIVLAIEAAPKKLILKKILMKNVEALVRDDAVLATNSSSLKVSDVTRPLKDKTRAAGMHFLTPANIAPLVEVVRGPKTSPQTLRRINTWLRALGKLTVNLNRDVTGMLVNRVQGALMREAFDLIDRGIATPEDIDTAVRFGFGFRYIACDPIKQRDFNGLEIHRDAAAQIYPTLHNGKKPARCLQTLVRRGQIGVRTGQGFYKWDNASLQRQLEAYDRTQSAALKMLKRS